jgi:hypothetical protein
MPMNQRSRADTGFFASVASKEICRGNEKQTRADAREMQRTSCREDDENAGQTNLSREMNSKISVDVRIAAAFAIIYRMEQRTYNGGKQECCQKARGV